MAPRQKQVIQLVMKGQGTTQIAKRMGIKERTVLNLKTWAIWHLKYFFGTIDNVVAYSTKNIQNKRHKTNAKNI